MKTESTQLQKVINQLQQRNAEITERRKNATTQTAQEILNESESYLTKQEKAELNLSKCARLQK